MTPVEETDIVKRKAASVEPEPDAFAALTPRGGSSTKKKKSRTGSKWCEGCNGFTIFDCLLTFVTAH